MPASLPPVEPAAAPMTVPTPETLAAAEPVASPEPPSPSPRAEEAGPKFGQAYIKVVGCGGGGGNAIARMISAGLQVIVAWLYAAVKQLSSCGNPCRWLLGVSLFLAFLPSWMVQSG